MSVKKERIFQIVDVVSGEQKYATEKFKLNVSKDKKEVAKKEVSIFTKRAYEKEVSRDVETMEVGTIKPWKKYKENCKKSIATAIVVDEDGTQSTKYNVYKKKPFLVKGYANVEENRYLHVAKNPLPIALFLLLLLLAGGLFYNSMFGVESLPEPIKELLPIADSTDWDGEYQKGEESEAIAEQTEIPGYANLFVSKENPVIDLINPTGNTVYFKYIISEGEEILLETDLIEPGKVLNPPADLYSKLTDGEHVLTFQINAYDINTQAACNGATQTVNIERK